jgi:hypothetical protein
LLRLALIAFVVPAVAFAASTQRPSSPAQSPFTLAKSKSVIDKSCLMICKRWGEHDCLEWKMVCKGDADYPKGIMLDRAG